MKILSLVLLSLLYTSLVAQGEAPVLKIAVGEARAEKSKMAYPEAQTSSDPEGKLASIREVVMADLNFSSLFDFLSPNAFLSGSSMEGVTLDSFKITDWATIGTDFLIKTRGAVDGRQTNLELHLFAAQSGREVLAKHYSANSESLRKLAHTIANDIMFALTKKKGPFTSKIAFVSDRTGKKEVYLMDYDGHNPIKVTANYEWAIAPALSPDGRKLTFTAITKDEKNVRNWNLFTYDMIQGGPPSLVSNRSGMNSGVDYAPNGSKLALTMSFLGNPEIFTLDPDTKVSQQITNSVGMSVDPSWSPDSKQLAFVSDRSGVAMIFKMDANGSNVQRLTFAGKYNATPSWSPAGNKIAFAGWDSGKFDIFVMNTNGTNLERLTKNMGNNEDPSFAPDGYFLVYSSNRDGKKNIYITNIDNTIHFRLTSNFGNCEAPRWGPSL